MLMNGTGLHPEMAITYDPWFEAAPQKGMVHG